MAGLPSTSAGCQRSAGLSADVVEHGRDIAQALAERLGLRAGDPLVPRNLAAKSPEEIAAVHAVASAVRHLSEREAAFARTDIYKAALGFGLPAAMPEIERRVEQLLRQGELVRGKGADRGLVTTAGAIAAEQRIVASVEAGRGLAPPIVDPADAGARLQALSQLKYGITLNQGQEAAGRLLLGSSNRIVAIQGVAEQARAPCSNPSPTFCGRKANPYSGSPSRTRLCRCWNAIPDPINDQRGS